MPVLKPALQSNQCSLCGLHRSRNREGEGLDGHIVSIKRAADERKHKSRKIIDEGREKYRTKNGSLRSTSTDSKETTFVILINHASAPIRKERLSLMSKTRSEVSQNTFVEKREVPVESFREINSSEDRPRARPGFVKPI